MKMLTCPAGAGAVAGAGTRTGNRSRSPSPSRKPEPEPGPEPEPEPEPSPIRKQTPPRKVAILPAMQWTRLASLLLPCLTGLAVPVAVQAQATVPLTLQLATTCPTGQIELHGLLGAVEEAAAPLLAPGAPPPVPGVWATLDRPGLRWTKPLDEPLTLPLRVLSGGDLPQIRLRRCAQGPLRLKIRDADGRVLLDHRSTGAPTDRWLTIPLAKFAAARPLPRIDYGRQVLAFFYGWYGAPDGPAGRWLHWNPNVPHHDSTHTPVLGWHDSADEKALAQQAIWGKEAGLDGFVVSLWPKEPHQDLMLQRLLAACHAAGLTVSGYLEAGDTPDQVAKQLEQLAQGPAQHPAWQRLHGRPVLFLYTRIVGLLKPKGLAALRVQEAKQAAAAGRQAFFLIADTTNPAYLPAADGLHTYMAGNNPAGYRTELEVDGRHARLHDSLLVANIVPGYDDSNIRIPGTLVHREEGRLYPANWAAANRADWVIITSWNEWHEGSCIEPAKEYGEQYLRWTRQLATAWRRGSRTTSVP